MDKNSSLPAESKGGLAIVSRRDSENTGAILHPSGTLTMYRDIFGSHTWSLMGRGQGYYKPQNSPYYKEASSLKCQ
jgi:proteasome assembly chaperone (PAC2) family protein